jgi:hypothetical protein
MNKYINLLIGFVIFLATLFFSHLFVFEVKNIRLYLYVSAILFLCAGVIVYFQRADDAETKSDG